MSKSSKVKMHYSASENSRTTSLVALENLRHFKLVWSYFGGILNVFIWQDSDDRQETQKQKARKWHVQRIQRFATQGICAPSAQLSGRPRLCKLKDRA